LHGLRREDLAAFGFVGVKDALCETVEILDGLCVRTIDESE